jgi:hypothetical protein
VGIPPGRNCRETNPVRLTEEAVVAVDAWISRQGDEISGWETIRLLDEAAVARRAKRKGKRGWA